MKIIFCDESNMVLFFNQLIQKVDFKDRDKIDVYFRDLFLKLKDTFHMDLSGYYIIDIYLDDYYGAVIEIEKEDLDYFEYDDNQVDMQICMHQVPFLYELEEYVSLNKEYFDIICYHNRWYVKLKKKIDDMKLGRLLEYAEIHYQEDNERIIKRGVYFD